MHRLAEVGFAAHIGLDAEVLTIGGVGQVLLLLSGPPGDPLLGPGIQGHQDLPAGKRRFPTGNKAGAARALTGDLLNGSLRSHIAAESGM